jgi:hypothetical protein
LSQLRCGTLFLCPFFKSWEFLLTPRTYREKIANAYGEMHRSTAEVAAWTAFNRGLSNEPGEWSTQTRETYSAHFGRDMLDGLAKAQRQPEGKRLEAAAPLLKTMFAQLLPILRDQLANLDEHIGFATAYDTELAEQLQKAAPGLRSLLPLLERLASGESVEEEEVRALDFGGIENFREDRDELTELAIRTDKRMHDVVSGSASERQLSQLGHTTRDAEHLAVFLANTDVIDFIQVDGPFYRRARNDGRRHPLHRHGLWERVFKASGLESALAEVVRLSSMR